MPEFRHTNFSCGPRGQATLQRTECPLCRWRATGNGAAVKAAEYAHVCAEHADSMSTTARLFVVAKSEPLPKQ